MQRWIVLGVLALGLVFGGGVFAYWLHRQNKPAPMWVEIPINPDRTAEEREKVVKELLTKLHEKDLLLKVSKDMGLAEKWKMSSDTEAEVELSKRIFVELGDTAAPMGRVPAIHVGVRGKKKEAKLSGEISVRLMDDVWKIFGIQPPPKR